MARIARASMLVLVAALGLAAPASADNRREFLDPLLTKYVFLNEPQLAAEGAKICRELGSGVPGSDAVVMVSKDLDVSVHAAFDIVSAAIVHIC